MIAKMRTASEIDSPFTLGLNDGMLTKVGARILWRSGMLVPFDRTKWKHSPLGAST